MKAAWAEPDQRDDVVDYVRHWTGKTDVKATKMISWIGISRSKYYDWKLRYGKHIDISYLNIAGTFYYMCSILDGFSRYIVHEEIRETMKEEEVEIILQRAKEKFPGVNPRIISDNGPQFISKDFKEFIRLSGMTHVRTSPYYPQSNGKLERYHKTIKTTCIRKKTPLTLEDARRIVSKFVAEYNNERLHSAIGYVTPKDKLQGQAEAIQATRDAKLTAAREMRNPRRQAC